MRTAVLVGTLDTKGAEYEYVAELLRAARIRVLLVDASVGHHSMASDVSAEDVARAAGADLIALRARGDRGAALDAMSEGAARVVQGLCDRGECDGVLGMGGSGGTTLAAHVMQRLRLGLPKVILSTIASGDTSAYVGTSDILMMNSVTDVAGLNRFSRLILANAAHALAGMINRADASPSRSKPLIAASMFGVTTPGVTRARGMLEAAGKEVVTFHMTGAGGRSMERVISSGMVAGVLDVTTTEIADEIAGGLLSAGPTRLDAAAAAGVPQVVSLGALDMINFQGEETVPDRFRGRAWHRHSAHVTLVRTSPEECVRIGATIAAKLTAARGPVALFVPLGGLSMLSVPGAPLESPEADEALFSAIRANVGGDVELVERDDDVNAPAFAEAMAQRLLQMITDD